MKSHLRPEVTFRMKQHARLDELSDNTHQASRTRCWLYSRMVALNLCRCWADADEIERLPGEPCQQNGKHSRAPDGRTAPGCQRKKRQFEPKNAIPGLLDRRRPATNGQPFQEVQKIAII